MITSLFLAAVLVLAACQGCSLIPAEETPNPTLTALSAAVAGRATEAQEKKFRENDLATAQAEATEKSELIRATQTARAEVRSEVKLAEATVAAPIVAELPQYGLDPKSGHVGWVHDPLTLDISGYQEFATGNNHMEVTAADFALAADITWDTRYGSSGCGFMFRSNGNAKNPSQYMVLATRFANGHVIFTALADGEIANVHDFYPHTEDRAFDWQNGSTNRLAIIAQGTRIEIYTNGVKIGEVDTTQPPTRLPSPPKPLPPVDKENPDLMRAYDSEIEEYVDIIQRSESAYQTALKNYMNRAAVFEEGFLAMIAATDSGRTVCTFEDAWLWQIEP